MGHQAHLAQGALPERGVQMADQDHQGQLDRLVHLDREENQACRVQQDPLVNPAQEEKQALRDHRDQGETVGSLVAGERQDQVDSQEKGAHPVLQGHQEQGERMALLDLEVQMAHQDSLVQEDSLAQMVSLASLAQQAYLVPADQVGPVESPVAVVIGESQAHLAQQDQVDQGEPQAQQERGENLADKAHLAKLALMADLDHLEKQARPVQPVNQDLVDRLVSLDLQEAVVRGVR